MAINLSQLESNSDRNGLACIHWIYLPSESGSSDKFLHYLDQDELERASGMQSGHSRTVFVRTRAALRHILSMHLDRPPGDIKFGYGPHGKPHLDDSSQDILAPLHFNVSHSNEIALIALSRNYRVGIDIEYLRSDRPRHMQIARRYFSTSEVKLLESLPPDEQLWTFYSCWARKEAFAKAVGTGIQIGFDKFDTGMTSEKKSANILHDSQTWSVHDLEVTSDYAAAVAIECEADSFHQTLTQFSNDP